MQEDQMQPMPLHTNKSSKSSNIACGTKAKADTYMVVITSSITMGMIINESDEDNIDGVDYI